MTPAHRDKPSAKRSRRKQCDPCFLRLSIFHLGSSRKAALLRFREIPGMNGWAKRRICLPSSTYAFASVSMTNETIPVQIGYGPRLYLLCSGASAFRTTRTVDWVAWRMKTRGPEA